MKQRLQSPSIFYIIGTKKKNLICLLSSSNKIITIPITNTKTATAKILTDKIVVLFSIYYLLLRNPKKKSYATLNSCIIIKLSSINI